MENGAIITLMDLVSDIALNLYGKKPFSQDSSCEEVNMD